MNPDAIDFGTHLSVKKRYFIVNEPSLDLSSKWQPLVRPIGVDR